MDVTPRIEPGQNIIKSYGNGRITAGQQTYKYPVFITPDQVWENVTLEKGSNLLQSCDIIIIAGEKPFDAEDFMAFQSFDTNVEIMTLDAAARTFNALLAEGRRVGLYIVKQK